MHTISPYSIRCFNPAMRSDESKRYHKLNNIAGKDLFDVLAEFVRAHSSELIKNDAEKRAYKFESITINSSTREIFGWMRHGIYGVGTDIVDIDGGAKVFDKKENNAEMISHYIHFFIPFEKDEAICVMHSYRNDGVKTVFFDEFNAFFKRKVNPLLAINPKPLSFDLALKDWMNAIAKEIKVVAFKGVQDRADKIKGLGHTQAELTLKPEKKRKSFGFLKDFYIQGSPQTQVVEMLETEGAQVKTIVQLGTRRRTFRVGSNRENPICQIDVDDDVKMKRGMPVLESMNVWVSQIIGEFCDKMYPGGNVYRELENQL